MHYDDFIKLTKESEPLALLTDIHLALWYAFKDNWDMAHRIVQDINTQTASWIHAYLHRVEGDLDNANYWYNRAKKNLLMNHQKQNWIILLNQSHKEIVEEWEKVNKE